MRIVGQEQIAEVFGVAPKTIVEWQEAGFPIEVRGSPGIPSEYETEPCINWLVDREVKKVQAESPRDRLFRLQADAIELEQAEKRGVLVRADAIEPRLRAAVVSARELLLRMPGPLAAKMDGADRKKREVLMREAFDAFLRRLAELRPGDEVDDGDAGE